MTPYIQAWLASIAAKIPQNARVLEVGSRNVNGSPRIAFKTAREYIGVDVATGTDVDFVVPDGGLVVRFGESSFDVVVCCEVLEHSENPLRLAADLVALTKPRGFVIVTSPSNGFPEHRFPRDYWRIMPDAYDYILLRGCIIISRELVGPQPSSATWCYLAQRNA